MTRQRIPARPTVYKGIRMRSRMEAEYAQWLDSVGHEWQYEPQCFADESGQYLPDFLVAHARDDGEVIADYVELKPFIDGPEQAKLYQRRMAIVWSSEPGATLLLLNLEGEPSPGYLGVPETREWLEVPWESAPLSYWLSVINDDEC